MKIQTEIAKCEVNYEIPFHTETSLKAKAF